MMLRVFVALVLLAGLSTAGVVYRCPDPESVQPATYVGSDDEGILVRFDLMALTETETSVGEFGEGSLFRIPSHGGYLARIGEPDLPTVRRMVKIPNTGGIELEVVSEETAPLGVYSVPPYQPSPPRSGEALPYIIKEDVYNQPGIYPEDVVSVESVEILRDLRVAWLRYTPVRIDPTTGQAWLTTSVTVRLVSSGSGENELVRTFDGYTRSFLPFYEEVLGFEPMGNAVNGCYLVIGPSDCYDICQGLIDWKRQKGYEVRYGIVPDIGSTSDDIDDYIEDAFNTWSNPPEWILIVGGEDAVPTPYYSGHAADNIYGVVGSGCVPDIHVGRFTGSDTDDITYMSWKIHQYESDPYEPATSWFQKAISIGSTDFQDPSHSWEYAEIFMAAGMTVDYFCDQGGEPPTTQNVFNSIEEGKSLISFIGHGSSTGWSSPPCGSISDVQGLTNGRMLPWVNSIACYNGQFDGGYCYGESWLAEGSESDVKGGIGFMGATTASPVGQTDSLAEYTFRGYFEEEIWNMGAAVDYGKMKVDEFYGSSATDNNHMHMIFGCPETDIFYDTSPITSLVVTHDDVIYTGTFTVTVANSDAPIEGALVGAVQDTTYLDGAYTNSSGVATLSIPSLENSPDVTITATYHNHHPSVTYAEPGVGIGSEQSAEVGSLSLAAASPNPFQSSTAIGFSVPSAGNAELCIYDMSGRLVRTLHEGELEAGSHSLTWDGTDHTGRMVSDGVYLYRLRTPGGTTVRSCVLLR
ncbi:T9SS type A sorting domain-containing protein [Candidatus Fermentibacteria bacterium]|nr:T9SS type A sorting domain-containing protein [Candidatus Fermentibacteria bacterium]